MSINLTDFQKSIAVGDVLMVKEIFISADRPRAWRWFGLVHSQGYGWCKCYRLGAVEENLRMVRIARVIVDGGYVQPLHPDEWPDGVHAFRMKLILEGKIDI
jgi:hypothetical protein